ncbi:hypothetical protein GWA97_01820 [Flavobacterium sp. LaA7.5]|nr:hypothetical protein [Flavobacterium salilacus subsp. altitudinum]
MGRDYIKSNCLLLIVALLWLVLGLVLTFITPESLPYQAILGSGVLFSGYAVMTVSKNDSAHKNTNKKNKRAWI